VLQSKKAKGTQFDTLPTVQLWSHVEVEIELFTGLALVLAGVEVNHVLDLGAAAIDDPVVAVERRLVAHQGVEAGAGRERRREAGEGS